MTFNTHLTEYAGLPVFGYRSREGMAAAGRGGADPLAMLAAAGDPGAYAWRLSDEEGDEPRDGGDFVLRYYERFCADVEPASVAALVVGNVEETIDVADPGPVRDALLACAPRWTGLRSLFYADLTYEEAEVSWIEHGDLSGLLDAFPGLERLGIRGTGDTSLAVEEHRSLRSLTLEGGGLPPGLVKQVLASRYPALEHLELWLGVEGYGGTTSAEDLAPLLEGRVHTGIRSLGLRNAEDTDTWVRTVAGSAVLERLEVLDLSMGTLTDAGAEVLLGTPAFRGLRRLDLHRHFMTAETERRLAEAFTAAGVETDVSGRESSGSGRPYPAVTE
ncbi:hypothetical protein SAMN05421803_103332 [Nocardiopsis flavescens]|uniref:STM4015 family protein n=1 Tax=Nocardiopsis flavescens TaxID=758803 RepID=A0A1M6GA78_9ACTN|nr:STM4015 family protein [Nocardiopsis flavescens]SHJ06809.1 hypothetical protein SAMN05421803_103332 [Nocardiopsis flavescens]